MIKAKQNDTSYQSKIFDMSALTVICPVGIHSTLSALPVSFFPLGKKVRAAMCRRLHWTFKQIVPSEAEYFTVSIINNINFIHVEESKPGI